MATGDTSDMKARLRGLLPPWFPSEASILDALLAGLAVNLAWGHGLLAFVRAQARIGTASGGWLDLIAWDFFGARFLRRRGEQDAPWSLRIKAELLRPRATKGAIALALSDLTGRAPELIELWHPGDCGAYDTAVCGYDVAGRLGSYDHPNQILIRAFRPIGAYGVPNVAGWDTGAGGYDAAGPVEYTDPAQVEVAVSDPDIYRCAAQTAAAGVIPWVQINP